MLVLEREKKEKKEMDFESLAEKIEELTDRVDIITRIISREIKRDLGGKLDEEESPYFTVEGIKKRVDMRREARKKREQVERPPFSVEAMKKSVEKRKQARKKKEEN